MKSVKKPAINLRKPYDYPTLIKHKNSQGGRNQSRKFFISGDDSRQGYASIDAVDHSPGNCIAWLSGGFAGRSLSPIFFEASRGF